MSVPPIPAFRDLVKRRGLARVVRLQMVAAALAVAAPRTAAADTEAPRPDDRSPRGELSLDVDTLPKHYRLACPDRDGGVQHSAGEWDDYLDASLCWRPAHAHRPWVFGLALHGSGAREGALRAYDAGLGFDVGVELIDPRRSPPIRLAAIGRYSGGILGILGYANGVALQRAMETSTCGVGIEAEVGGSTGPQLGAALGYQYQFITDVLPRVHLAGVQHGPVASIIVGWRW